MVVGGGQDVAALDGLVEEAEDVHDDQDALADLLGGARHVRLLAVDGLVDALLLVARGDDGRDVTAGGGVAAGGGHGRHFVGGVGGAKGLGELGSVRRLVLRYSRGIQWATACVRLLLLLMMGLGGDALSTVDERRGGRGRWGREVGAKDGSNRGTEMVDVGGRSHHTDNE